jgi:hypothetical protein
MNAVLYRADGQIAVVLEGGNASTHASDAESMGLPYILTADPINPFTHYVKDGVITAMSPKPSDNHQFNYADESWELTDEQAGTINREIRLELLVSCDWTQLPDSPLTDTKKSEWATYRQQLRDLDMTLNPNSIVWPVEP